MRELGSNADRTADVKATLTKRLDELEKLLNGEKSVLTEEQLPRTLAQLRFMDIPEAEIFPIGSPSTLNRIQSPHLRRWIDRATEILARIKTYQRRPTKKTPSATERCRRLNKKLREERLTIAGLAKALQESEMEVDLLTDRNKALTNQLRTANRKIAELTRSSGKRSLHVVRKREE